jgi:hypothetical protein
MSKIIKKEPVEKSSHAVGIGLGIAALAAAAAGAYYLYGSDKSVANRKHLKSWMLHMKAEAMDEIENIQDLTEEAYDSTIDKVSAKYSKIKNVDAVELAELAKKMKSHWKEIEKDAKEAYSQVKK